jgi:hypothetical protein
MSIFVRKVSMGELSNFQSVMISKNLRVMPCESSIHVKDIILDNQLSKSYKEDYFETYQKTMIQLTNTDK